MAPSPRLLSRRWRAPARRRPTVCVRALRAILAAHLTTPPPGDG